MINDVKKAYDLRNKNPVNHASAELLEKNDLESETLKKYVLSMNNFLFLVEGFVIGHTSTKKGQP